MVTVRKYPTVLGLNPGLWGNPNAALNVEDNLCAFNVQFGLGGTYRLYLKTYNFALPPGAILDKFRFSAKLSDQRLGPFHSVSATLDLAVAHGITYGVDMPSEGICPASGYNDIIEELNPAMRGITAADFNTETFLTYVDYYLVVVDGLRVFCDSMYIEVDYHLGGMKRRLLVGEGL